MIAPARPWSSLVGADTAARLGHIEAAGTMLGAYDAFIRQHHARDTPLNAARRDRVISSLGEHHVGHVDLTTAIKLLHTVAANHPPLTSSN